ncbi:MAG: D-glycero-beta-D-manno-heptose 1-phosphate adenylyltransferase [Gemmatimonadaceae bacterium]|jgi:D-beta-D-heptose 7-phosphate kinase/D-beta-D-heptose 1-phosphate adenosyltransferase
MSDAVSSADKVLDRAAVAEWRGRLAGPLVFTNGVFDLLHPGHVDVLEGARAEGAHLVVGINSDASVRRLGKGPDRPIRTERERARVIAGLAAVDAVVIFDEDTPAALVDLLQPDVIVKGGDYAPDTVVGADVVRARGGRVVIIPLTAGQSTTSIVERVRAVQS